MLQNALRAFQSLVEQFPDSEYSLQAKPHIELCLQNLAAKEMDIGLFYFKSKKYEAALSRFAGVVTVYPDYGLHASALDYMAQCRAMVSIEQEADENVLETPPDSDMEKEEPSDSFDHGSDSR